MYQPFNIGTRFRIVPPDTPPSTDGRIDIVIAKGAFGSGEHETTASCLEILEDLAQVAGASVLDLGSGTGILALGALKLGAERALCVDISPDAVKTCRRNGELNGFSGKLVHHTGSLDSLPGQETFDLVLANIYGDLLVDLADDLASRVAPGGLLLLSGMLWEYNYEVRKLYEKRGCTVVKNRMLEEFSTVLLRKNGQPCRTARR